jgi:hypothetical protein
VDFNFAPGMAIALKANAAQAPLPTLANALDEAISAAATPLRPYASGSVVGEQAPLL